METTITLPFPPQVVWGTLGLLGIALASALVFVAMPKDSEAQDYIVTLRDRLGLSAFPVVAFLMLAIVWSGIAFVLTTGLINLILDVLSGMAPDRNNPEAVWEFRFKLVQITALTTVLGAVIALPITMSRLRLQRSADDTARESLFNEKINAATEGLYARQQVTERDENGQRHTVWQDDIVQRCAAVDQLGWLAQERPFEASRICRILSVFIREHSAQIQTLECPSNSDFKALREWLDGLAPTRSDIEKAAQVLGSLRQIPAARIQRRDMDLRGAKLRNCKLQGLNFGFAYLEQADLSGSDLTNTSFEGAVMPGACLVLATGLLANFERAKIFEARAEHANFIGANFKNASIINSRFSSTNFTRAQMQRLSVSRGTMQSADIKEVEVDSGTRFFLVDLNDAQYDKNFRTLVLERDTKAVIRA